MQLFELFGSILVKNDQANSAISQTTGLAKSAGDKIGGAMKGIAVAVAGAFAVDKIKDFGVNIVQASASAQAMNAQFSSVFGELENTAQKSLDKIASETGVLSNRMKESFTKITSFAKVSGMETADAMALGERAMMAIADSSAFYDRSLEDTTESLQSFLKGNYENDAQLGLSATEFTRNAKAMELYGMKFKDLDEAQKQLTLLGMVEDANRVSGALGQASRESDGLENVLGNLKRSWVDFQAVIGEPLLEAVIPILQGLASGISSVTDKLKTFFDSVRVNGSVLEGLKQHFKEMFDPSSINPEGMLDSLSSAIPKFMEKGIEMIQGLVKGMLSNLPMIVDTVAKVVQTWIGNMATMYPMILTAGVEILNALIQGVASALPQILDATNNIITLMVDTVLSLLPTIIVIGSQILTALVQGIVEFLPQLVTVALNLITKLIDSLISNLPMIIQAGIVLIQALVDGIFQALPILIPMAMEVINTLLDVILENLPTIVLAGVQLLLALIDGIVQVLPQLVTTAVQLIIHLATAILANLPKIISAGIQIIVSLASGIIKAIPQIVATVPKIVSAIWDAMVSINWIDLGLQIIKGIISGIVSGAGGIISAITGVFGKGGEKEGEEEKKDEKKKNANGTDYFEGGWSVVGEQGRELVKLPTGSQIVSNHELESALKNGGKNGVNQTINIYGVRPNANEVARKFRQSQQKLAQSL